jgi:antitoxin (DNA-binding transcriptional repressor) of toxin-antitoxin stability system
MITITTHEAKTHLSRYLAEVEKGQEFIIARGKTAVAMLVPVRKAEPKPRPKVGETLDPPWEIPDSVFAPLTEHELKEWGLRDCSSTHALPAAQSIEAGITLLSPDTPLSSLGASRVW